MPLDFFVNAHKDYIKSFSKQEAVKELLKDKRIANIKTTALSMNIITIPIVPKMNNEKGLAIGTFKIILKIKPARISYVIERLEGELLIYNYFNKHVHLSNSTGNICWENVESEIRVIKSKKDWYWLAKRIVDLLYNYKDESYSSSSMKSSIKELAKHYKLYHKIKGGTKNGA